MPGRTPLVDVHAHFLTDDYVEEAIAAGHRHPDGMAGWPSWSVEDHLALMDTHDIATSLLSISSPGVHFRDDTAARNLARRVNDAGAAVRDAHPDRFGHFASLPLPDVEGSVHEATRALDDLGSDGVTIETNAHGRYPGDPGFDPLWSELDARRAIVFMHPTSPPHADAVALGRPRPMLEFVVDSARAVSDLALSGVLTRHPGIRWVITHGGGALPLLADRIELFRNAFLAGDGENHDPSIVDQIGALWFDLAGTPFPRQVPALTAIAGTDRLLYGSDHCWTPARAVATQIATLDTADPPPQDEDWRRLTTRNAVRLLPSISPSPLEDGVAGQPSTSA